MNLTQMGDVGNDAFDIVAIARIEEAPTDGHEVPVPLLLTRPAILDNCRYSANA